MKMFMDADRLKGNANVFTISKSRCPRPHFWRLFFAAAGGVRAADLKPQIASIVIEADTGQILSEIRSGELRPQASLVKMMLTMVVFDRVANGEAQMDAPIRASAYASRTGGSQVYLAHGETFTLGEDDESD